MVPAATAVELPLVFLGGLLGSAHCIGMCGGFAVMVGAQTRGLFHNLRRQMIYSLGRIFTYAALGGALGYFGMRLDAALPGVVQAQALTAFVAGALLIVVGLSAAGVFTRLRAIGARLLAKLGHAHDSAPRGTLGIRPSAGSAFAPACLATGLLGTFLRAPGWTNTFLAGVFTGFLPCGLVYAFLALAGSAGNLLAGAATMAVFGAGTIPLMVLAGGGAALVSVQWRQRLLRAAAWCVVLTGVISLARGISVITSPASAPQCPMCATAE